MAKVRVKANKLENPTVRYISLVQRGANRIPFRIIKLDKQETDMTIDLGSMFKRVRKEESVPAATSTEEDTKTSEPTVAALVIEQADQNVEEILKSAGFKVEGAVTNEDGTVAYKQDEVKDGEATTIFKMSDGLLAVVKNFDDSTVPETIKKFAAETGFYPEMDFVAMVCKAEGAIGDIRAYTDILEATLPVSVFKAAADIDALGIDGDDADDGADDDSVQKAEQDKDEGDAGAEALVELIQKAVEEGLKSVNEVVEDLKKQVGDLATQVSGISEQGTTLTTKMTEVEKVAKAAADKIKGTVVASTPVGDREQPVVKKADEDPRSGVFDTAFLPRRTSVNRFNRR